MDKNEALLARIRHKNLTTVSSLRPACILRIQIEVEKIPPTEFAFIFRYKDMDSTPDAAPYLEAPQCGALWFLEFDNVREVGRNV
jgi:hypothetical protein